MDLLSLNCQHCSAPLQVPENAKFVTCSHCGSQLAIRRTGSVAYTETLDAIDQRTERMAEQLDELHRKSTLSDLDPAWQIEREQYYVTGKHGHRHLPTTTGSIAGGLMICVFGTIWTLVACGMGGFAFQNAPGPFGIIGGLFPLFGIAFVGFGLWMSIHHFRKAAEFERAQRRYQRERAELVRNESETETPEKESFA